MKKTVCVCVVILSLVAYIWVGANEKDEKDICDFENSVDAQCLNLIVALSEFKGSTEIEGLEDEEYIVRKDILGKYIPMIMATMAKGDLSFEQLENMTYQYLVSIWNRIEKCMGEPIKNQGRPGYEIFMRIMEERGTPVRSAP